MIRLLTTDRQEIFDVSVVYFAAARTRCHIPNAGCRYLILETGQRCVVGNLLFLETLEDAYALAAFRGGCTSTSFYQFLNVPSTEVAMHMFADLQHIHDAPFNWNPSGFIGWSQMYDFALTYELSVARLAVELGGAYDS